MSSQQGPSDEAIDRWVETMLSQAQSDMEDQGLEVNPDTLSQFAKEQYDLPFNATDAVWWLRDHV